MHRVKIFLSSSLFSFYQGMVRTMKMSFFRKKNILSLYTQILVEFPLLMAGSSEWTRLKHLLRESSLLTSGFPRIVYKLIVPWPGSAVGKKMGKNGVERHKKITWTLFFSPQIACSAGVFFERAICSRKRHVETSRREEEMGRVRGRGEGGEREEKFKNHLKSISVSWPLSVIQAAKFTFA